MRLVEFFIDHNRQNTEEGIGRNIASGALALALTAGSPQKADAPDKPPRPVKSLVNKENPFEKEIQDLTNIVTSKYKIDKSLAREIVTLAKKHEKSTFPKAEDLLALIGIESSFRPHAVSSLSRDPAIGLTQIRPGVWGLNPKELAGNIDKQIEHSVDILSKYKKSLGNSEDAIHAYNVGITDFRRGNHNPRYVEKFKAEKQMYTKPKNNIRTQTKDLSAR